MSFDTDKAAIEKSIKDARVNVDLGNALKRLQANRDFKLVVTDGYFKDEAVRLVHLRGDPAHQHPNQQAAILASIDAISQLHGHLLSVAHSADQGQKAIDAGSAELEAIAEEEAAQ